MLETLRSDEALDAGGFGIGFFAFAFGHDFTADDEFTDLGWKCIRVDALAKAS